MTPLTRFVRQFLILLAFFALVGAVTWGVYRAIVPPAPEPTPDPTAFLKPIKIISTHLIKVKETDYDFIARVRNPNAGFGSPDVKYSIEFKDSNNAVIQELSDSFYIMPSQSKYIVITNITLPRPAASADIHITSIDWRELDTLANQGVNLSVVKKTSGIVGGAEGDYRFAYAEGQIFNNSDFDIAKADIVVVLVDKDRMPIAVNTTEIMTFLSNTTRGFEVSWFEPIGGDIADVLIEPNTNVFNNANFIRYYGGIERFQQQF